MRPSSFSFLPSLPTLSTVVVVGTYSASEPGRELILVDEIHGGRWTVDSGQWDERLELPDRKKSTTTLHQRQRKNTQTQTQAQAQTTNHNHNPRRKLLSSLAVTRGARAVPVGRCSAPCHCLASCAMRLAPLAPTAFFCSCTTSHSVTSPATGSCVCVFIGNG